MDSYIQQLKSRAKFGYTIVALSIVALLLNRVFTSPFSWILVGIGLVGLWTGIAMIGNSSSDKYKYLKQTGAHIQAKVLFISLQAQAVQYGQRSTSILTPPYVANFQIVCEGIDPTDQSKKTFVSDKLSSRPNLSITPETTLGVWVDKKDSGVYWVDLSNVNFDNHLPYVSFSLTKNTVELRSYDGVNYQKI